MHAACLAPIRSLLTLAALGCIAAGASALGCGSSSSSGQTTQSGATSGAGGGDCGLKPAENSEWCAADAVQPSCSSVAGFSDEVCGVAFLAPTTAIARSTSVSEFAGTGAPQVSCFEKGNYPAKPGTPATVKVSGLAKIFSHGCNSHDLQIQFYKVQRDGGSTDGDLGDLVGTTTVTGAATFCMTQGTSVANSDCTTRYECPFEYDGVPTNTELVIKTSSPSGHQDWAPLYEYNDYIETSEVSGGVWQHDVRALAADDYSVIPKAALGQPITPGNGAIAGEVHDCGNVRLSGALAGIDQSSAGFFYFNSVEAAPLPDLEASSTSILGLYAGLDIKPGPIVVAAMGEVDNKPVTLGYFRARIFPDSVTWSPSRAFSPSRFRDRDHDLGLRPLTMRFRPKALRERGVSLPAR